MDTCTFEAWFFIGLEVPNAHLEPSIGLIVLNVVGVGVATWSFRIAVYILYMCNTEWLVAHQIAN